MKKSFIFSLFLVSGVFFLEPSISNEIVEDKNLIEKVSFDIWWEDKYNESVITLRTYPEDIKTIQVGNGRFINKNQVLDLIKRVKIQNSEETYYKYPHELSGGEQQRIMIAMAIAKNPQLIVADEATSSLDSLVKKDIIDLLIELKY